MKYLKYFEGTNKKTNKSIGQSFWDDDDDKPMPVVNIKIDKEVFNKVVERFNNLYSKLGFKMRFPEVYSKESNHNVIDNIVFTTSINLAYNTCIFKQLIDTMESKIIEEGGGDYECTPMAKDGLSCDNIRFKYWSHADMYKEETKDMTWQDDDNSSGHKIRNYKNTLNNSIRNFDSVMLKILKNLYLFANDIQEDMEILTTDVGKDFKFPFKRILTEYTLFNIHKIMGKTQKSDDKVLYDIVYKVITESPNVYKHINVLKGSELFNKLSRINTTGIDTADKMGEMGF